MNVEGQAVTGPSQRLNAQNAVCRSLFFDIEAAVGPDVIKTAVKELAQRSMRAGNSALSQITTFDESLKFALDSAPGELLWWINKALFDPVARRNVAKIVAEKSPAKPECSDDAKALATELETNGIVKIPGLIRSDQVDELRRYLISRETLVMDGPTYLNLVEDVVAAPHALGLAMRPKLLSIVAEFLGAAPTLLQLGAWRSIPTPPQNFPPHIFHRDKDDFRACKLFLYLADVGPENGPHVFVKRSHDPALVKDYLTTNGMTPDLVKPLFQGDGRQHNDVIPRIFGPLVTEVYGKAGTAFLACTFGYHRGKMPTQNNRLVMEAVYGNVPFPKYVNAFSSISLQKWPDKVADNALTRHALRLLIA
ncbi:MAG: hypothetical protein SFV19_03505 [Rhodospirillaceae bacterium]|nr:hypothetical protein [Rhodospirillaceae bacterium]